MHHKMHSRDFLVLTLCDSMSKIDAQNTGQVENIGIVDPLLAKQVL